MTDPILEVEALTISVPAPGGGRVNVVEDVSFALPEGGSVGIVGESGSGKTMACMAVMGLLPTGVEVESGSVLFRGEVIVERGRKYSSYLRGAEISMVLQDPMTALDPCFSVGGQLRDVLRRHRGLEGRELKHEMRRAFERVQLDGSRMRLKQYPHQFSGGMKQRAISAIALAGNPRVLIADEPTTALDVTTQAKYLRLLDDLRREASAGFSLIMIAHDLYVVRQVCEYVVVMYAGQVVEQGETSRVFSSPQHPYTRALLASVPSAHDQSDLHVIEGQAPEPGSYPTGCRFYPRCVFARDDCLAPQTLSVRSPGHSARCVGSESEGWISG